MNGLQSGLGLSCNWIAERRQVTYGVSFYNQLVWDCVAQIKRSGVAYCFTTQQADAIQTLCKRKTTRGVTDVGFIIRLR